MLKDFLDFKKPINIVINISESKAFKSKDLFISQNEYKYLKDCLTILKMFVLATKKLQGHQYSIIYYTIPFIYQIFTQLEILQKQYKVSIYFIFKKNLYILILYKIKTFKMLLIKELQS